MFHCRTHSLYVTFPPTLTISIHYSLYHLILVPFIFHQQYYQLNSGSHNYCENGHWRLRSTELNSVQWSSWVTFSPGHEYKDLILQVGCWAGGWQTFPLKHYMSRNLKRRKPRPDIGLWTYRTGRSAIKLEITWLMLLYLSSPIYWFVLCY